MQIASMSACECAVRPTSVLHITMFPSRNKFTPGVGGKECYRDKSRILPVTAGEKIVFDHLMTFKYSQEYHLW